MRTSLTLNKDQKKRKKDEERENKKQSYASMLTKPISEEEIKKRSFSEQTV